MIRARSLTVRLDRRIVLTDVSLEIRPGELLAVIGANGAGKSTLLRACAGLLPVPGITLDDRDLNQIELPNRARRIAWLAQRSPLDAAFTVAAVVAQGRFAVGPDPRSVAMAMDRCQIAELAHRRFDHLSGGERQRVLLARCLAQGADHVLADEPTAHLDPAAAARIQAVLMDIARSGQAVAVATHDLAWARQADRVAILDRGRCLAVTTGRDLSPEHVAAAFDVQVHTDGWRITVAPGDDHG